jgi:hypothetical protein
MAVHISTSGPTIKRDSFMSGLSTNISLGDYDEGAFAKDEKLDSPISPTDSDDMTKYSPTDSIPSSSFADVPHLLQEPERAHARPESQIFEHPIRGPEAV